MDEARLLRAVARRIRELRGDRSQREFARDVGLPASAIQRYEAEQSTPRLTQAVRIAWAEGVGLDWLVSDPVVDRLGRRRARK